MFTFAGSQYLTVYGGVSATSFPTTGSSSTALASLYFLKMTDLSKGWFQMTGPKLNQAARYINGGLVKSLKESSCDMMFIENGNNLYTCKGNYTWTKIAHRPMQELFMLLLEQLI